MAFVEREHQLLRLSDGRLLGYAEYGDPEGQPVLVFHGMLGSRLLGRPFDAPASALGIRILAPDRPGIGLSDFKAGRKMADWPSDVVELVDRQEIERFAVVGSSAGGPYALACAWRIPERLGGVALVSSVGPPDMAREPEEAQGFPARMGKWTMSRPWIVRPLTSVMGGVVRRAPDLMLKLLERASPGPDQWILADAERRALLNDAAREAFRAGARGPALEFRLLSSPWDFPISDISSSVDFWYGEADTSVPGPVSEELIQVLPDCRVHFMPGEGHLSMLEHLGDVLQTLVGHPGA